MFNKLIGYTPSVLGEQRFASIMESYLHVDGFLVGMLGSEYV